MGGCDVDSRFAPGEAAGLETCCGIFGKLYKCNGEGGEGTCEGV